MNDQLKEHINAALKKGTRLDGRKLDEFRKITINTNNISTAEGSAELTCGETHLFAGVKMVLGTPYPDRPDSGTMMVSTELRPMANREYELGPPSIESIETARVIDRTIRESKMIDEKSLCVTAGEKVWTVSIDICPLNADGNLIDLGALAAIAALQDTTLPEIDADGHADYKKKTKKKLKIGDFPIAVTIVKIGENLLVDPTAQEMKVADARLTVATMEDGTISALQKGGSTPFTIDEFDTMLQMAITASKELRKLVR